MFGLRFWLAGFAVLALAAFGIYRARGSVLPAVAQWLDVGGPPRRADFVMVLDGDRKFRPQVAAALVKEGLADKVLVAIPGSDGDKCSTDNGSMSAALVQCGVPACDIAILSKKVANTHDEALALAGFMQSRPSASVTVVTSGYHTRRAQWVFAEVLGKERDQVSFVSAPAGWLGPGKWWQTDSGVHTLCLEYGKLAYYLFRYGTLQYYSAAAAGLAAGAFLLRRFPSSGHIRMQ